MNHPIHDARKNLSAYREDLGKALENTFLRTTLDTYAVAYKASREAAFSQIDGDSIIAKIAEAKDYTAQHVDELYEQFKAKAEAKGVIVHRAATAAEASDIIANIAKENNVKRVVKSKSMTSKEIWLNERLIEEGMTVDESDLGEWILQLRSEPPSHMVLPALHLSRFQVADDFTKETGEEQDPEVQHLVKVARVQLRPKFIAADMGISGANLVVAETGSIGIVTNEGNGRLANTLPPVHVAIMGIDKLLPTIEDALRILLVLPRNGTCQAITSYVTWINGPGECSINKDKKKIMHFVFLDNGRSALAKDPIFSQIYRCIRCGACASVCPVYRLVGGQRMGYVYMGAIGLLLTYFYHGRENAKVLAENCINCESCKPVCAGGIDLPRLIRELRSRLAEEEGAPKEAALVASLMKNRKLFHRLIKFVKFAQLPSTGGSDYQRHLPNVLLGKHGFKALPAIASKAFRDIWPKLQTTAAKPHYRVALFAGCSQDFIYPEQLEACVKLLVAHNVTVEFPFEQTCCGLPLEMMGQRATSKDIAQQNLRAFDLGSYDAIITLCASCASHLKYTYPQILEALPAERQRAAAFSSKIVNYCSFVHDTLGLKPENFTKSDEKVTFHASCHLCRGCDVVEPPRELIRAAAEYVPCVEEDICCGFGGTYSAKFPELSATMLENKLGNITKTGATRIVMDCPGCIMQIRGGAKKHGHNVKVSHISELLAETMKR